MYSRKDDTITLTMTVGRYRILLMALGYAIGCAQRDESDLLPVWIGVVNKLNEGNPQYTPYKVSDAAPDR